MNKNNLCQTFRQRLKFVRCSFFALKTRLAEFRFFGLLLLGKDEVASSNLAISSIARSTLFQWVPGFFFCLEKGLTFPDKRQCVNELASKNPFEPLFFNGSSVSMCVPNCPFLGLFLVKTGHLWTCFLINQLLLSVSEGDLFCGCIGRPLL